MTHEACHTPVFKIISIYILFPTSAQDTEGPTQGGGMRLRFFLNALPLPTDQRLWKGPRGWRMASSFWRDVPDQPPPPTFFFGSLLDFSYQRGVNKKGTLQTLTDLSFTVQSHGASSIFVPMELCGPVVRGPCMMAFCYYPNLPLRCPGDWMSLLLK